MTDPFWLNIALEAAKGIMPVILSGATILLAFYTRRINEKLKLKTLENEVARQTGLASQSRTFMGMDFDTRVTAITDSIEEFAKKNDINVSSVEARLMVENSFTSLKTLERSILKTYKLQLSKEKEHGETIKK